MILQKYRKGKFPLTVYWFGLILCAAIVAACAFFFLKFPDAPQLKKPLLFVSLISLTLLLFMAKLIKAFSGYAEFDLYEDRIINLKTGETIYLKDISDLFQFKAGKNSPFLNNLAFRKSGSDAWHLLSVMVFKRNFEILIIQYILYRKPVCEKALQSNQPVSFNYISKVWEKNLFALSPNNFLNTQTKNIVLTKNSIQVNNNSTAIKNLLPVYLQDENTYKIRSKQNETIFEYRYEDFFSADLFRDLFNDLVKASD